MYLLISLWSVFPIDICTQREDAERELAEIVGNDPSYDGFFEIIEWTVPADEDDVLTNPVRWN